MEEAGSASCSVSRVVVFKILIVFFYRSSSNMAFSIIAPRWLWIHLCFSASNVKHVWVNLAKYLNLHLIIKLVWCVIIFSFNFIKALLAVVFVKMYPMIFEPWCSVCGRHYDWPAIYFGGRNCPKHWSHEMRCNIWRTE